MRKLKAATCPICSKPVNRHDSNRIKLKVADGSKGQGINKHYHLKCYQETGQ